MAQIERRLRRHVVALGALATGAAVVVTSLAQSSTDLWWTGYSNGPEGSRYFASRQINKSNVAKLQVAWTYPFGDTHVRAERRPRRRLRARAERIARRRRREDREGDSGSARTMNGMTTRGLNYWESARRPRPAAHLRDEQPAAGGGREDRQVDHVLRHQRRRRPARGDRWPRSRDDRRHSDRIRPAACSRT